LAAVLSLLNERDQPNLNALSIATRNLDILALNIKSLGYDLARTLAAALPDPPVTSARHVGLRSKLATQADMETDWAAHWHAELGIPRLYHRKGWEWAFVLQALHDAGLLRHGTRGLGFGCGGEPMASYLASHNIVSLITDLASEDRRVAGWTAAGQHAANLDHAYHPHLVDRTRFDRFVSFRPMDMNDIHQDLAGFDFCWSLCAFEHLGSIEQGVHFVEESLRPLRPGGLAVHTTEFNINPRGPTINNWPTVLFQQRHIEALAQRLRNLGHHVEAVDYDPGDGLLDRFIDVPPWRDGTLELISSGLGEPQHLKVAIDGFVCTSIGLIVRKSE
jgi:SAM-dependent methyltransferase